MDITPEIVALCMHALTQQAVEEMALPQLLIAVRNGEDGLPQLSVFTPHDLDEELVIRVLQECVKRFKAGMVDHEAGDHNNN